MKVNNKSNLPSYPSESTNQLIKLFNNRGDYERAFNVFDNLVKQNNITIISLLNILNTCARSSNIERGRQIESLINQSIKWKNHLRLHTSLIKMYMKFQMIDEGNIPKLMVSKNKHIEFILAERIFERIRQSSECDVIVYNTMLKGYLQNHKAEHCFSCVDKMRAKISPDNITYILLLNACTILRDEKRGKAIHDELLLSLDIQHVHLQNALIDFYGKINEIAIAEKIFSEMNLRETSTYNTLMKAYLVNDMPIKLLELFEEMKQSNFDTIGPLGFKPDLITFMAVCDACEKLGLLNSPDSSYEQYNWKTIFSKIPKTAK
ncbi:unnamed protein product [Rotaria socialis]|uniref:Pentatricopeptide repeat-containing protein n=1 Tax=Rotaria socialis TaxID=392032 RepID=A0A820U909_9BILA|nr:unnamed protein product [Rotaria socialis]CAF4255400.1 unnamed protein product [Rotaria socialis]CAF4270211.1 unnamed protein product [Rotaria socialis]CAF4479836.1 unnamed protein product [Rotaria socialis]CAF4714827.1 unnamed protein product [Rotaria socialis]